MTVLSGGELAVRALRALGVEQVFGIVSVHNLPIVDALERADGIRFVPVRHEQAAAQAADGAARASGRLGVALTSTGPGTANAMGGLFEAQFASSPVLLVTGQVETRWLGKGKGVLHEAERQLEMLTPVVRRAERVRSTASIAEVLVRAGVEAQTGRPMPVAVEIPIDLQYATTEANDVEAPAVPRLDADAAATDQLADALRSAERPVIWAGGGVIRAGGADALTELAERLGAPVVTSINGRGAIREDHPLALGSLTITTPIGEVLAEADVVLAVGTRFQGGATREFQLELGGRLLHVDADPSVIGRNYRADLAVVGDARLVLEHLVRALGAGQPAGTAWADAAREKGAAARNAARLRLGPDHEAIMNAIRHFLPRDGIVVRDATVPAYFWGDRLLPIYEPRTSMHPTSAAIGPGLGLAIGAATATGKRTVLIQGDGGLMLDVGELATAVQERLPIVICVFNDRGYGILRSIQARTFDGRQAAVDLVTPDFVALAGSLGMRAEAVEGVDEFVHAVKLAMDADGPTLLDIDLAALTPLAGMTQPPPRQR